MPQLNNIVLNDGSATPVARTFSPVTTDGTAAILKERVGVPVGYSQLGVSVRPPVKGSEVYKTRLTLAVPHVVTIDGKALVDYTDTITIDILSNERSTAQDRKNARVLAINALSHATIVQVVENLEPLF